MGRPCWTLPTCRRWWTAAPTRSSGCSTRMRRRCRIKVTSQKREKETQKVVFEVLVGDWCGNAIYNLVLLSISASRLSLSISISSQQCFASFLSCKVISFHLYRSPNTDQCHDHVGIRAFDLGLFDHYHETKMKSIKMIRHRSQDVCPWGHLFLGLVSLAPLLLPGLMYRCS